MKNSSAMNELLNMDRAELQREVAKLQAALGQTRVSIEVKKEKNSAKYKRDRRQLARMLTAVTQKSDNQLPKRKSSRTVQPS